MRRHTRWYNVAVLTLLAMVLIAAPVLAQEGQIQETFESESLPEWELSPEAAVRDGVLRLYPGSFALRFGDWRDVNFSVRVKLTGEGGALLHYSFRDQTTYVLGLLDAECFLERVENAQPQRLTQADATPVKSGQWMTVQVNVKEGTHTVTVDGETVLSATDPNPLPAGAVMFHTVGEAVGEFDDLTLTGQPVHEGEEPPMESEPPAEGEPPVGDEPPMGEAPVAGGVATPAPTAQGGSIVDEFFASQASAPNLTTFVINLVLSAIAAYILGRVYIHWGSSLSNRRRFAANFMLMTVTTTFIILVVRSSVALSLGLVGALSIVRFRTAVKEPEELAYLFFAIGLGIGLGDNQRLVTLLALAAAIVIVGLHKLFYTRHADVNLHLTVASHTPGKVDLEAVVAALKPHCAKWKLLRFDENHSTLELAFLVEFRELEDFTQAKTALRDLADGIDITFLDNQGIW